MKKGDSQNLARTIIIIAITVIMVVIVFKALGFKITRGPSSAPAGAFMPAASPSKGFLAPGQSSGETAEPQRIAVRATTITLGSIKNYIKTQGDVVANSEVKIYPKMEGKILERKVSVGAQVSAGDVIALVDPSEVGKKYLPNPVESTVSGTILSIPVHEGDKVTTTTVVATVGDISRIKIETYVPEKYISNLKIGTAAEISFDAIPETVFDAKISEINPVVDAESRTIKISLRLNRADSRVLVGMSASVKFVVEQRKNVIIAPRDAITQNTEEEGYVFVIKNNDTVEQRAVTLGMEAESAFEIKKGLNVGDKVVTEGKNSLKDGSSIKIINGDDETKTGAIQ
jgi:multidrug efflux pump subunit AcrA (membrane-fusion protein)